MVRICIVGSVLGNFDDMYNDISDTENKSGQKIDIVLCCGDLLMARNTMDINSMFNKHKRSLGDFWKYYVGEKISPYLTIVVGGNCEAINYLQELPYGGWVAPNIYYLGYAGIVNVCGLRIAGISGIYKRYAYEKGHFEHRPFTEVTLLSACYHRNIETLRMLQVRSPVDVVLSHDWPRGIHNHSDELLQLREFKPNILMNMDTDTMGSPALEKVLLQLKPRYWFAANINFKFAASVKFDDMRGSVTKFLGLDKCDPVLHYIQMLDIDPGRGISDADRRLCLDPEWLCILRATDHLMSLSDSPNEIDEDGRYTATEDGLRSVSELFGGHFDVPDNFEMTAPAHGDNVDGRTTPTTMEILRNPQTDTLCEILDLVNPNVVFLHDTHTD